MTALPATSQGQSCSGSRRRTLPRAVAFWTVGSIIVLMLAASSAPSPLYPVYQAEFGFSALTLTLVFAAYVAALLAMLLTVGRLSDHLGRRPVVAGALVVEAAAMAIFLSADGTAVLVAARVVQGLATGAALGVLSAYLLDLQPEGRSRLGSLVNSVGPTSGLAIGAVATGALVQYGPDPMRLVFAVLTGVFVVLAAVVVVLPETVQRRPGAVAALRPEIAVPSAARRAFMRSTPIMIATWALGGLSLSLIASVLGVIFGLTNVAVVGLLIGVFAGSGAAAALLVRELAPESISLVGASALSVGTALFLAGLITTTLWVFVVAMVVAGAGFGSAFLGALRSVTQLAAPDERAALLSAVYIVSYLAFSVPAVVAGVLVTSLGLRATTVGYGSVVLALSLITVAILRRRRA